MRSSLDLRLGFFNVFRKLEGGFSGGEGVSGGVESKRGEVEKRGEIERKRGGRRRSREASIYYGTQ